jgi:hypothetical protein
MCVSRLVFRTLIRPLSSVVPSVIPTACRSADSQIPGRWEGRAPNGDRITYEFKADNSVVWSVDAPGFPGSVSARYSIDYTAKPAALNIYGLPGLLHKIAASELSITQGATRAILVGFTYDGTRIRGENLVRIVS